MKDWKQEKCGDYEYLRYIPKIEKGYLDKREYSIIKLNNGLEALLISDTNSKHSVTSLDVHVGSLSDPDDALGLAHFCEHLLFMGTSKYPDESFYSTFLSRNGGFSNAYTSLEHTNYHFEVESTKFEETLDIFSEFFKTPLFKKECVDREINAVDSEHNKNLRDDMWRIMQIGRHNTNRSLKYKRFATGNLNTLKKDNIRQMIIDFYKSFYSANIMRVCLLSNHSINHLTKLAIENFKDIKNYDISPPLIEPNLYTENEIQKKILITTISDLKQVMLEFPVPDTRKLYEYQPANIIASLIGDEGQGSVFSFLKNQGLIESLSAGEEQLVTGFVIFTVIITLTSKGLENYKDVVKQVFTYIHMLKKRNLSIEYVNEIQKINKTQFDYAETSSGSTFVSSLASGLHDKIVPHFRLLSNKIGRKKDIQIVEKYLSFITPSNFRLIICSQKDQPDEKSLIEPWYGTRYTVSSLPDESLYYWAKYTPNPHLKLPSKNGFISTDFAIQNPNSKQKFPYLVYESENNVVWYKSDHMFETPKLNIRIFMLNPISYISASHAVMLDLCIMLMNSYFNEFLYPARMAGQSFGISPSIQGFVLSFYGYSDKLRTLVLTVSEMIKGFEVKDKNLFISKKEEIISSFKNIEFQPLYSQASYYMNYCFQFPIWSNSAKLEAAQKISLNEVNLFMKEFINSFSMESMINGNITQRNAVSLCKEIHKLFSPSSIPIKEIKSTTSRRYVNLNKNTHSLYKVAVSHSESCICLYYQLGSNFNVKERMITHVLSMLISQPYFNQIRTIEQLGYIAFANEHRMGSKLGLTFVVQSSYPCTHLDNRINEFLSVFEKNFISNLQDEHINPYIKSAIQARLKKPNSLFDEADMFWSLITTGYYELDQREKEINFLKELNAKDVKDYFYKFLGSKEVSSSFTIYLHPKGTQPNMNEKEEITSPQLFKNSNCLCPVFTSGYIAPKFINSSY